MRREGSQLQLKKRKKEGSQLLAGSRPETATRSESGDLWGRGEVRGQGIARGGSMAFSGSRSEFTGEFGDHARTIPAMREPHEEEEAELGADGGEPQR